MEARPTFHPNSAATAHMMNRENVADLVKVTHERQRPIVIPDSPLNRALVPIHFGPTMTKSRLCSGSVSCKDCQADIPLTFHLYVGCYDSATGTRHVVGLGTAIPKKWQEKLPTFKCLFKVWRKVENGPILLEENPYMVIDPTKWKAWDVMPDILRIFRGRRSLDDDHDSPELRIDEAAAAAAAADADYRNV